MEGAYALVRKSDLSVAVALTGEQAYAIRTVENGSGDGHLEKIVLEVMEHAHAKGLWLGCDCRREGKRRPVVAPCRSRLGNDYWRVLGAPQLEHERECVFHRSLLRRAYEAQWNREARQPPGGYVAVLREEATERGLAQGEGGVEGDRGPGRRSRPALSRWLLRLLGEAGLHRMGPGDAFDRPAQWMARVREATGHFAVAPGRRLSQWWFTYPEDWERKRVHAKLRAAAGEWPEGTSAAGVPEPGCGNGGAPRGREVGTEGARGGREADRAADGGTKSGAGAVSVLRCGGSRGGSQRL